MPAPKPKPQPKSVTKTNSKPAAKPNSPKAITQAGTADRALLKALAKGAASKPTPKPTPKAEPKKPVSVPVAKPKSAPAKEKALPAPAQRTQSLAAPTSSRPAIHAVVENLQPVIDGGRFPAKAVPGEMITVTADIFRDGHDKCEATLLVRKAGATGWLRSPMVFVDNDSWQGTFSAGKPGAYEFTVEARTLGHGGSDAPAYPDVPCLYAPVATLRVDSALAEYSAWYEMWARSQGTDPNRSATFAEMTARLPEIQDLGFDVIYLPPIHPIGVTKRKGADNTLTAQPGEPGCPYAIGNQFGGHKAVDPELGSTPAKALPECRAFIQTCRKQGFAVALDFALNCSPDHPYVKAHPDWYYREMNGTIKCAENPPKRYEDVYPLNFFCEDRDALWTEIKSIVEFWMGMGITIFRVDNPHTKPFAFWEWLIADIKRQDPSILFLSEAFTRPKVMKRLAKVGFDLSYTYFTWRITAAELREYVEELAQSPAKEFMKPIFFPTTPDILPLHLQNAPREMFMIRFALAATLVGAYGMYNGYELCDNAPVPGKEEFLHSEKYQYKVWDWNSPGNIKPFIRKINDIRREHPAMKKLKNIRFHDCNNPQLLAYSKSEGDNILLFIVNLDPYHKQSGTVSLNLEAMGIGAENIYGLYDLMTHESYVWSGRNNYVELTPHKEVLHAFKIEKF